MAKNIVFKTIEVVLLEGWRAGKGEGELGIVGGTDFEIARVCG